MNKDVGYISFVMIDEPNNMVLNLGGAGFSTKERLDSEWQRIPSFEGHSAFVADLEDSTGSIVDDKSVSADVITARLGKPIHELIASARLHAVEEETALRNTSFQSQ
ncbi:hypothetical protein GOP96_06600 [Vibrio cholerae]|nr:hypothetical protein [Vibrio cholerae]